MLSRYGYASSRWRACAVSALLLCRLTETDETKEARAFAQLIREQRRAGLYGSDA